MSTPPNQGGYGQHAQQPYPGQAPYAAPPAHGVVHTRKGFFGALFDVRFEDFISPKLVKLIFILGTVMIGLSMVLSVISAFRMDEDLGLFMMLVAPVWGLFSLMFFRVGLEIMIVIFRIAEELRALRQGSGIPR